MSEIAAVARSSPALVAGSVPDQDRAHDLGVESMRRAECATPTGSGTPAKGVHSAGRVLHADDPRFGVGTGRYWPDIEIGPTLPKALYLVFSGSMMVKVTPSEVSQFPSLFLLHHTHPSPRHPNPYQPCKGPRVHLHRVRCSSVEAATVARVPESTATKDTKLLSVLFKIAICKGIKVCGSIASTQAADELARSEVVALPPILQGN